MVKCGGGFLVEEGFLNVTALRGCEEGVYREVMVGIVGGGSWCFVSVVGDNFFESQPFDPQN